MTTSTIESVHERVAMRHLFSPAAHWTREPPLRLLLGSEAYNDAEKNALGLLGQIESGRTSLSP